ncbi:hypothetical protein LTR86_010561 [Recurvomyces mirabilis]|nr:hypothetical protein LTR86_010561 [Recurvomyces mirabilis]
MERLKNAATQPDGLAIKNMTLRNKRTIFPLSRELRDQIYGYLLHHDYIREEACGKRPQRDSASPSIESGRNRSTAHTYRYHTSILGVSKLMRAEAEQVLALDQFVIISFKWPGLSLASHCHDVPIVCEDLKAISKFTHHAMRVHIQHGSLEKATDVLRSFIMVAADLPVFCSYMMLWTFAMTLSPAPLLFGITTDSGCKITEVLLPQSENAKSLRTKIQMFPSPSTSPTKFYQESLLAPFRHMAIGGQKVTFLNSTLPQDTTSLQAAMGPPYVSAVPMLWQMIGIARRIKHQADDLVGAGDFDLAPVKYVLLSLAHPCSNFSALPLHVFEGDSAKAAALLLRVLLDAGITKAFLMLRLGQISQAAQLWEDAQDTGSRILALSTKMNEGLQFRRDLVCLQGLAWLRQVMTLIVDREGRDLPLTLLRLRSLHTDSDKISNYALLLNSHLVAIARVVVDPRGTIFDCPDVRSISFEDMLGFLRLNDYPAPIFDTPAPLEWTKPVECDGLLLNRHKEYVREHSKA